jgi:hypothetical protein
MVRDNHVINNPYSDQCHSNLLFQRTIPLTGDILYFANYVLNAVFTFTVQAIPHAIPQMKPKDSECQL